MSNSTNDSGSIVSGMLGTLFVGLKLGGVIDWSWWWVTFPFWGGIAVASAVLLLLFVYEKLFK